MQKKISYFTAVGLVLGIASVAVAKDSSSGASNSMLMVVGIVVLGMMYLTPTIIGYIRKKSNKFAILILNLLLGWSVIGWVVALIWACTKDKPAQIIIQNQPTN